MPYIKILLKYIDNYNDQNSTIPHSIQNLKASNAHHRPQLFEYYNDAITNLITTCDITQKNDLAALFLNCAIIAILQDNIYTSLDNAYQSIGLALQVPQGYICAAQALLSLAKYNDAVDICDYGLSPQRVGINAKSNDEYYGSKLSSTTITTTTTTTTIINTGWSQCHELLKGLKREALLKMDRTTTTGILTEKLPIELLDDIFINLLSAQDRIVCTRVSRSWRKLILDELPQISYKLRLEYTPESLMEQMIASTISHGKAREIVIQFDDYDHFEATILKLKAFDLLLQYKCIGIKKLGM